MAKLSGFTSGPIKQPLNILIHGENGIGKTQFCASAPDPVFIEKENGSARFDVKVRFTVNSWEEVLKRTNDLLVDDHEMKTVVYDSLDFIESLMWKHLCEKHKVDSIEDTFNGYGKWVNGCVVEFTKLMDAASLLREKRGMNIMFIAHSHIKTIRDPMNAMEHDRHVIKLQDKSAARWQEFVDAVLFAKFSDVIFKVHKNDRKAKASGEGTRILYTTRRATFEAKNRLGLKPELPLSYSDFAEAVENGQPDSMDNVLRDIHDLRAEIGEKDLPMSERILVAVNNASGNISKLIEIRNGARKLAQ